MMKFPILVMPDERLSLPSAAVERIEPRHIKLAEALRRTMQRGKGVGLAAIQIGLPVRMFVVSVAATGFPYYALVNPEIIWRSEETASEWEMCLSLPGRRVMVNRPVSAMVKFMSLRGEAIERSVDGFCARVIQHEVDHLDGIVLGLKFKPIQQEATP